MKVSKLQIQLCRLGLDAIVKEDLAIKTAYKLSNIYKIINDEHIKVEQSRIKLVEKLGEKKEYNYEIPKEKMDEFIKEYEEILKEEIKIEIEKISIEELENITISAINIERLKMILMEKKNE